MIRTRPLLIPFSAMAIGLTVSLLGGVLIDWRSVLAALICLALSVSVRSRAVFSLCLLAFFLIWGMHALSPWLQPDISTGSIVHYAVKDELILEGVVDSRPILLPDGGNLELRCEKVIRGGQTEIVHGRIMLYVAKGAVPVMRGDRIRCRTRIIVPHLLGLPGEFDFGRYLALEGVAATARVADADNLVLVRGGAEESLLRSIDKLALQLGDGIRNAIPEERVSSVLSALLIGDQKRVPQNLTDAYTRAGVNHILSISGFHIGILAAFLALALLTLLVRWERAALFFNLRRTTLLATLPVMLVYLLLTGAAPATSRSVIMLTVCVLALYAEREKDPVNILLLAAFILVAGFPPTLFDISFQLSFIALWGIIIAMPPVMRSCERLQNGLVRTLVQFTATSLAASLVTVVPVLFVFRQASLNGVLTNFLIVPLMGYGAVVAGFCALPLVALLPARASLALWPAAKMIQLSNSLIMACARLPVINFYGINALDMALFVLLLCILTFVKQIRVRLFSVVMLPLVAVTWHLAGPSGADGRLHITMLSVGQAESMLLRFPGGTTMLVDGGGYLNDTGHDFGQRVLAPALGAMGVNRVDYMVATHGHPDHAGGLPYVAAHLAVGEYWEVSGKDSGLETIRNVIRQQRIPIRKLAVNDRIDLPDGVRITVLSPEVGAEFPAYSIEDDQNERSLVFRLEYRGFSMLFTADAGVFAEQRILASGHDLHATVLKVGHHGSRYSTSDEFLERVKPKVALISAGAGNRFGLPASDTIAQFARHRIPIYRTDRDSTIELVTDGTHWSVTTPYAVRRD